MTTMQAVQITEFGGPDVLQTADVSVPVPEQVLVKLDVAGVNYFDTNWWDGLRGGHPLMINGTEGAGIVAGLGAKVRRIREGDRVAYWTPAIGSFAA